MDLPSLFSLEGRVALVTGGSSGIGQEIARASDDVTGHTIFVDGGFSAA